MVRVLTPQEEDFPRWYTDERGAVQRPWQTSWGGSTRLLGATIMVHGDDHGLRLPPRVAPVQVVVLVARAGEGVLECASRLVKDLVATGIRAELDPHADVSLGRRVVDWELRGVLDGVDPIVARAY